LPTHGGDNDGDGDDDTAAAVDDCCCRCRCRDRPFLVLSSQWSLLPSMPSESGGLDSSCDSDSESDDVTASDFRFRGKEEDPLAVTVSTDHISTDGFDSESMVHLVTVELMLIVHFEKVVRSSRFFFEIERDLFMSALSTVSAICTCMSIQPGVTGNFRPSQTPQAANLSYTVHSVLF
jgi:hypothetical protein